MYTASGGYYLDGKSFGNRLKARNQQNKWKLHVFQVCIFVFLFISSFLFGAMMQVNATNRELPASLEAESSPLHETHIVSNGETLWSIAKLYMPAHGDIREYIHQMKSINQLKSSLIYEGERLLLPSN